MIDSGAKKVGETYLHAAKEVVKAVKNFTKKEIKETQKAPVSSDPVVQRLLKQQQQQEEKEKKSGWFHSLGNKLGDWGDKQYKRFVQPAAQAAAKFQRITTTPAETGAQGRIVKSMKDRINWAKISEYEGGRKLKGYVPEPDKSESGVTIATGFDLGARGPHDLLGLSPKLRAKLTPYLGFKKHAAEAALRELGPLTITAAEAAEIDKFSKGQAVSNLKKEWNERAKELGPSAKRFDELTAAQQTVAASVHFQYGSLNRTPTFMKHMQTGNWKGAIGELRNFGDAYKSRRKDEAMYLEASLHGADNFKRGYNVTPTMGQHLGGNVTNIYKGGDTNSSNTPVVIAQPPTGGDPNANQINDSMNRV